MDHGVLPVRRFTIPGSDTTREPDVSIPGLVSAEWGRVPYEIAWRVEPYVTPGQAVELHHALVFLGEARGAAWDPDQVWAAVPAFLQTSVRSEGARGCDLAGWTRAGLVSPPTRRFPFRFAPEWTYWRTLAKVSPGCGWEFAVAAAEARYTIQQVTDAFTRHTISLDELRFQAALQGSAAS